MKIRNLYSSPSLIDLGELKDNDPPIFEPINEYLIPNSCINSNGYIFKNFQPIKETISARHRNSVSIKNVIKNIFLKKKIKIDRPAISIMSGWGENFYHFTLESLPKLYILRNHLSNATVVFPKNLQPFHKEWIRLLELKDVTFLGEDEILQTPLAISSTFPARDQNHHSTIVREFRKWILDKADDINPIKNKKVFIGRKYPSKRNIINIEEVKNEVEKHGFSYIEMEDYNLTEQINIFRNAEKIIAVHGAALSHICFARPGIEILDLIHEDYSIFCFLKLAKILDIDYVQFRCSGIGQKEYLPGYRDIEVRIEDLSKLIK